MKQMNKQSGFTLIEMSVVILIAGLLVGAFFAFYSPYMEQKRRELTIERENKIARALSDYVQRHGRLPCPARPDGDIVGAETIYGMEMPFGGGVGKCSYNMGSGTAFGFEGIVPFRELGLTQDDATDGYYNPITYAVSVPATVTTGSGADTAHANCRTDDWINDTTGNTNNNRNKALFCCKDALSSFAGPFVEIYTKTPFTSANHIITIQRDTQTSPATKANAASFADPDSTPATAIPTDNLSYFAYALISHGPNGAGAYIFGKDNRRPTTGAGTLEATNASHSYKVSDTPSYVDIPRNDASGANHFDDIVLWRTQQGVMRELGNNSCALP